MFCTSQRTSDYLFALPRPPLTDPALTGSKSLYHVTILPISTAFDRALKNLHNHELLLHLDPEHDHYEPLPSDPSSPATKRYKVTDIMQALPKGIWGSTVTFEAEMTDTEDGVKWVNKAPLGLLQTSTWRLMRTDMVHEADAANANIISEGDNGEWALVEEVLITANKLILGIAVGKCESSWKTTHGKFVKSLQEGEVKSTGP
jgi:hypothetical protein